jgi:hypothetical protein
MRALSLDDPRWRSLNGGYRQPYDASVALREFAHGGDAASLWEELWNELHHQGDIGEASYAAIPQLVHICQTRKLIDWSLFALAATIEVCRRRPPNPPVPEWLAESYNAAWSSLADFGIEALRESNDETTIRSILAVLALHKGLFHLGRLLAEFDASEIEELYHRFYGEDAGGPSL